MTTTKWTKAFVLPFLLLVCVGLAILHPTSVSADELVIQRGNVSYKLQANVLVEAQDGGLLAQSSDGKLWVIEKQELVSRKKSSAEVAPKAAKQLGEDLLKELPPGFRIYKTRNFVFAYQTERAYAKWIGGLYERLFSAFKKFWKGKKLAVENKSRYPLTTIIFRSKAAYSQYVEQELGSSPGTMVAYYNLMTNRVAMYDLTAGQGVGDGMSNRQIHQILANPKAIPMVATVIHEATHQLMFNLGVQTRFSDTPLWLNEGLAMYFETPDLENQRGWRSIGKVNYARLRDFSRSFSSRHQDSLQQLVASDSKFQGDDAIASYAESWALVYFLIEQKPKKFVAYVQSISRKKPLVYDEPEQRLANFKKHFGEDLAILDREFIAFIRQLN